MTAEEIRAALGELAYQVRSSVSALDRLSPPLIAWMTEERVALKAALADAQTRLAAAEARCAALESGSSHDAAEALRARVAELEAASIAPPPTLVRLASRVGALAETLVSGLTARRAVGGIMIVIALGGGLRMVLLPDEQIVAIVERMIGLAEHYAGMPAPVEVPDAP